MHAKQLILFAFQWQSRIDEGLMLTMDEALNVITAVRGLKNAFDVKHSVQPRIVVRLSGGKELERDMLPLADFIKTLSNSRSLQIHSETKSSLEGDFWASSKVGEHELNFDIEGIVNPEKVLFVLLKANNNF